MGIKSIRSRMSFAPQNKTAWHEQSTQNIQNIIHRTEISDEKWIEETTENIGVWRDNSRSVYMRWAITINAMQLSSKHYGQVKDDTRLRIDTLRAIQGNAVQVPLAEWTGSDASERYLESSELIAAYGFADMFGVLEDIVFDAFEVFYRHNPALLLKGSEYRAERRVFAKRTDDPDAWDAVWSKRFTAWRRKKLYDGLHKLTKAYWTVAKLQAPSHYEHTTVQNWVETIQMFSVLRNHITHSAPLVTKELQEACQITGNMSFAFKEGEAIEVKLYHLQAIECFIDQYLTALNMSHIELVYGQGHFKKLIKSVEV